VILPHYLFNDVKNPYGYNICIDLINQVVMDEIKTFDDFLSTARKSGRRKVAVAAAPSFCK